MIITVETVGVNPGGHCHDCEITPDGQRPKGTVRRIRASFRNRPLLEIRLCAKHAAMFLENVMAGVARENALELINTPLWDTGAITDSATLDVELATIQVKMSGSSELVAPARHAARIKLVIEGKVS